MDNRDILPDMSVYIHNKYLWLYILQQKLSDVKREKSLSAEILYEINLST